MKVYLIKFNNCPDYVEDLNEFDLFAFKDKNKAEKFVQDFNKNRTIKKEDLKLLLKENNLINDEASTDHMLFDIYESMEDNPDAGVYIQEIITID